MKLIDKIKQMSAETLAAYLVYGYGDLLTASASKDKWQWVQTIAEKLNEDEGEPESAAVELVIDKRKIRRTGARNRRADKISIKQRKSGRP